MTEIFSSFASWFKEKKASPLYFTYIFSVILFNWKFFYALFWQEQAALRVPRIEYALAYLTNSNIWEHLLYFVGLPALSAFILIRWAPLVTNWAFGVHINFYYQRLLKRDEAKLNYEKSQELNLNKLAHISVEKAKSEKIIKTNISEEEQWNSELSKFKKNLLEEKLNKLANVIYKHGGQIRDAYGSDRIDIDTLVFADSNGLITLKNYLIQFTEKGKYFLKELLNLKDLPNSKFVINLNEKIKL